MQIKDFVGAQLLITKVSWKLFDTTRVENELHVSNGCDIPIGGAGAGSGSRSNKNGDHRLTFNVGHKGTSSTSSSLPQLSASLEDADGMKIPVDSA